MTVPEGIYSVEVGRVGFLNVRYYPVRVLYPDLRELFFRLPIGDVTEGAIAAEAILNGTLMFAGKPVKGATVCIRTLKDNTVVVCGLTNVFGEYALAAPPGKYQVQVRTALGELHETTVDVSQAGVHRSRIKLDQKKK